MSADEDAAPEPGWWSRTVVHHFGVVMFVTFTLALASNTHASKVWVCCAQYGAIGWNIAYQWMTSDLNFAQANLKLFLDEQPDVPWD